MNTLEPDHDITAEQPSRPGDFAFFFPCSIGLFALTAQTLLFRDFFSVFDGSELGVGAFFAAWLLWVAAGAALARWIGSRATWLPWVALLYIPAFALQHEAILDARALTGVERYESFPIAPMMGLLLFVNAPVSLLTGFLFPLVCAWWRACVSVAVSRVYAYEMLGACIGSLAVRVLLTLGAVPETVILYASAVLVVAVWCALPATAQARRTWHWALPATAMLLTISAHVLGPALDTLNARSQWSRLLSGGQFEGSFATPQGRYLFGRRDAQFVVTTGGATCETLPPGEHAAEIAALHLAQKPDARRILVFGPDVLGVCLRLIELPQVERVVWLHPDPHHPNRLKEVCRDRPLADVKRWPDTPAVDLRALAHEMPGAFDLVILNLPDVTTLALNRYCTLEGYRQLKPLLSVGGMISTRISGGENFLGGEIASLGASALATLRAAFSFTAIKPGDETWLFGSDADRLSQAPRVLRGRYAEIAGAERMYPSEGVVALYPVDRAIFQRDLYESGIEAAGGNSLVNTDGRPLALFHGLLLALKQAEWRAVSTRLSSFQSIGFALALAPLAVFALFRFLYLLGAGDGGQGRSSAFDAMSLVFSTGLASMALDIGLLFAYQARFGSLFLDIAMLIALFMFGTFAGGNLGLLLFSKADPARRSASVLLAATLAAHGTVLAACAYLPETLPRSAWMVLFAACGLFTGVYFPIAASLLEAAGRDVRAAGAALEWTDNLGGAIGALLTGSFLLPMLGTGRTLACIALLVATNAVPLLAGHGTAQHRDRFDAVVRPLGYVLFGAIACALLFSQCLVGVEGPRPIDDKTNPFARAARDMAGDAPIVPRVLPGGETGATYFEIQNRQGQPSGYVFQSNPWALQTFAYAGPISLAILTDAQGKFQDYRVLQSNETPSYLYMVESRRDRLIGRNLFAPAAFKGIDAVSGATATDDAVLDILQQAGIGFAAQALEKTPQDATQPGGTRRDALANKARLGFLCLTVAAIAAVLLRYRPRASIRRVYLLAVLLLFGYGLNLQYSTHQVLSLAQGKGLHPQATGPFFLLAVVPLLVLLFGNIYCGYLCPFGALQELVGDLCPARLRRTPSKAVWRYARLVKYALLLLLLGVFAFERDLRWIDRDPLVNAFSASAASAQSTSQNTDGAGGRQHRFRGGRGDSRDVQAGPTSAGEIAQPNVPQTAAEAPRLPRTSLALLGVLLLLSFFFDRFWCRNLCPAGAFLSLLNAVNRLRRYLPKRYPGRCDLGVRSLHETDCVYCDRCAERGGARPVEHEKRRPRPTLVEMLFLAAVLALAVALVAPGVTPPALETPVVQAPRSAGVPRKADSDKIKRMIDDGALSDHEAEYYRQIPE